MAAPLRRRRRRGGGGRLLDPAISFRRDEVTTKGFLDELERFRSDSGFLHKVFPGREVEAPELYELATGEPDAREDPNPDRIGGELVENLKLDVLRSDSPRQSEAAEGPGAALLRRHRGDQLLFKQKEKSPRVETGPVPGLPLWLIDQ